MTSTAAVDAEPRATFGGAFASEWLKAGSLRSTWWLVSSAIASTVILTMFWTVSDSSPTEASVLDSVSAGFFGCAIVLVLLGTILATADYENRAIAVYLAALPRRTPLVLAKVLLAAALGFTVSTVSMLLTLFVSVALRGAAASLGASEVVRVLADIILYGACLTIIATSVGLVFRSTIAGVGATLGFVYIVPVIIGLVPLDVFVLFSDTFPGNAATNFFTVASDPSRLDPVAGVIATVLWTAAWVAFAAFWVKRRNV
ncbi:ABC transporter permease [Microbacterium lacus]|uniref:ABC transporter permease n=1 Tax=Microbacterium lacus TaxID=415217 RepID=UPI00384D293F